jgi:hypothetical protein
MMQDYDITVAVGASRQLDAQGEYFYYNAGSAGGADPTIKLRGLSSGLTIKLKPGQGFRLPAGEKETSWVITNFAGAATIIGFVTVGDGDITDNRITGSVEVVDGGKNRTNANIAYFTTGYLSAVAGQYTNLQLWNPSGSGRNVIVEGINYASATTSFLILMADSSQLTANLGAQIISKKISSTSTSLTQVRKETSATPTAQFANMMYMNITANTTNFFKPTEPLIIVPNSGLRIQNNTLNAELSVGFEFYEESI